MQRLNSSHRKFMFAGASALVLCALTPAAALAQTAPAQNNDAVEEIVVTGQRAAIQSAQKIKQNAAEIVDGISADDIGKLPDRSVTEALQRVVGVTIDHTMSRGDPEHFSVEGSGVNIRGLTYVRSELNGRDSFTANGGRSLSFEDVPPELMAGVDIYKNPSAEQIEGAIGGLVNLRTQLPFNFPGLKIGASAGLGYGELSKGKGAPSGSLLVSDRWDTNAGQFGALFDVAYSKSRTRTDAIQQEAYFPHLSAAQDPSNSWNTTGKTVWLPNGLQWRTLDFDRRRLGLYGALQWKPNDRFQTSLTGFRSDYEMKWGEFAIFSQIANPGNVVVANGKYDGQGVLTSGVLSDPADGGMPFNDDVRAANRKSVTTDWSWNAQWNPDDKLTIKTDLQYVRGTTRGFDSTVATGLLIPSETIDLTGKLPTIGVDKAYMTDANNYYWAFTMDHFDESVGKEWAWRGDVEYAFDSSVLKSLRFGARYTDRSAVNKNTPYNWQAVSQTWMLGWYMNSLASVGTYKAPTTVYDFPRFFNGNATLPSAVVFPALELANGWPDSYRLLHSFRAANSISDQGYTWTPATYGPGAVNLQSENTYSGYAMLRFGFDEAKYPIDGNIGVRVVQTRSQATGSFVGASTPAVDPSVPAGTVPIFVSTTTEGTYQNNYTDVLPSLNLRMKFTDTLQARFAAAKAVARPDYSQLQAYTTLNVGLSGSGAGTVVDLTGTGSGNPYLKPTKSNQYDVTLEWYFAPTGSLTGAVFYKDLKDVITNALYNVPYAATNGTVYNFATTAPVNGASGTAKGFEVAYSQFFDFLPGWLSGFGVQANYTYVDSSQKLYANPANATTSQITTLAQNTFGVDTDGSTFKTLPLTYLSKNSFNVALMYEKGPVSARLAYNWRSKYLQAVNVNGTNGSNGFNKATLAYDQRWALPTWADDYGQLDGSVFYKLTPNVTLGIEAQNLTDSTYKQLMQQNIGMKGRAWFVTGRRFNAQVRYTF